MEDTRSERIKVVGVLCFILLIISLAVPGSWFTQNKAEKKKNAWTVDVSRIKSIKPVAEDTNNDGVVTWKEVVDKTLPMTDKQREELKKLPIDQKAIDALNDPNNLTASFSKNLYLTAASVQENNITDQKTKQALIDQISQEEADKIQPKVFTDKDIIIAKSESKASIKKYGNAIEPLLDSVVTKETITGDMTGVLNYLKSGDASGIVYLFKDKKRLDTVITKLQKVEVPPSAVILHLQMLNRASEYREVVDNLSKVETDPIRTSLVIKQYIPVSRAIIEMFTKYTDYFNRENIAFTNTEYGYVFIIGHTTH